MKKTKTKAYLDELDEAVRDAVTIRFGISQAQVGRIRRGESR